MDNQPKRKPIRIRQYDYSTAGAYFITVCTANKEAILWDSVVGADIIRPQSTNPIVEAATEGSIRPQSTNPIVEASTEGSIRPPIIPLSPIGKIVEQGILQIPHHYEAVCVDHYCVMPDHIHLILRIRTDENGRMISAPTISTVVGSMKRWVSRQVGRPIWQKSFYDHGIRNDEDYKVIWEYIDNNPLKYVLKSQHQPW